MANYAVLCLFAVIASFPILGILTSAVTPPGEATGGFSLPHSLDWANFSDAWRQGHFGSYMRNSLIVSAAVVVAATVFADDGGLRLWHHAIPRRARRCSTCSCSG